MEITAVILCGGKGERLRPYTDHLPKPLLPLGTKPILLYLLEYLAQAGITRFVLCTGYRAEQIEEFAGTQCDPAWDIRCVNSGDASMTERLRDAWPFVKGTALICYGDTLANVDIARLIRRHQRSGSIATMSLYRPRSPFGVVRFGRDRKVKSFEEKPPLPHWINIGYILGETERLRPYLDSADMVEMLDRLVAGRELSAHEHTGKHLTINTEKERQQAERDVVEFLSVLDT